MGSYSRAALARLVVALVAFATSLLGAETNFARFAFGSASVVSVLAGASVGATRVRRTVGAAAAAATVPLAAGLK